MHPDLKTVIELHHIDLRASELTAQIESLPSQIEALERGLQEFIRAHGDRKQRLAANQKERRDLEGEIQEVQSRISKHKDQLYEVKTNEQYRAMLKEIEGEQAKIREIEDRVLERMIEAEDLQKKVQEAESHLEAEKARVATEKAKLEAERHKAGAELGRIQAQRQELVTALSAAVLDLYERVRKARHGAAVAEVRDGFCAACNVLLRPQIYNEARTNEAILPCENCSRILYYVEPQEDPKTIDVADDEFEELKRLQVVPRGDWSAVFGTNSDGEIWPFVAHGATSIDDRRAVQGLCKLLDAVAQKYRKVRPEGGRFFIDGSGASYKDVEGREVKFAVFRFTRDASRDPSLRSG